VRFIVLALLPLIAIFFQSTFFASYSIKGVVPDLVLVFVIFYALLNGAEKGARYGLLCGLLEDLYTGRFIGMNAVSKSVTAFIIGRMQHRVFTENVGVGIIGVIIGSFLNAFIMLIIALIYFAAFKLTINFLIDTLYQVVYNVLLTTPIYLWYYKSSKRGLLKDSGER
jgi:rod shape-determining protein MreD